MTAASLPARKVVVLGTGDFAAGICASLCQDAGPPVAVRIVSRSMDRAAALADRLNRRLAVPRFSAAALASGSKTDLHAALGDAPLDALIVCTSDHSPAEARKRPSLWTRLVHEGGFGVTLPLQVEPALTAAYVCAGMHPRPLLVNAAYPDAVNPLIAACRLPVACGLGNVSTLATLISEQIAPSEPSAVRLLAHHYHLSAPSDPADELLAWLNDRAVAAPTQALAVARDRPRAEINAAGARASGALIAALLGHGQHEGHAPGPNGLAGGYPVTVTEANVALRLPSDVPLHAARAAQAKWAALDGVQICPDGEIAFSSPLTEAVRAHWRDFPMRLAVHDLPDLAVDVRRLRERLRRVAA